MNVRVNYTFNVSRSFEVSFVFNGDVNLNNMFLFKKKTYFSFMVIFNIFNI